MLKKIIFFISILFLFSFSYSSSASITTLSSSLTYDHLQFLSNNSYRYFFLRQYFIHLINISHSTVIQSMIEKHYLIPKLEQIKNRRRRDYSLTPIFQSNLTKCKLKTLKINFEELGLAHLIIRPKEYLFTYCDGSCFKHQSSIRTFFQSLISNKHPNILPPQFNYCIPSEYSDDNFLLRQIDGNMKIYPIQNTIVKQCACL